MADGRAKTARQYVLVEGGGGQVQIIVGDRITVGDLNLKAGKVPREYILIRYSSSLTYLT